MSFWGFVAVFAVCWVLAPLNRRTASVTRGSKRTKVKKSGFITTRRRNNKGQLVRGVNIGGGRRESYNYATGKRTVRKIRK